ncbi:hypothetical protein H4R18_003460 [Coemansia javaensis]|uniref:WD40 repeat-like protein n=1 Tax=Coemansia javaensis TaxID=2761396 RepID=A0A9W8H6Y9_9FUNG|nr:hypothetical protein H4R18_003460 [Coemansia javaensis]
MLLLSGSDDGSCCLWDARSARPACAIAGHGGEVAGIGFSGESRLVVARGAEIHVYDQRALGPASRRASDTTATVARVANAHGAAEIQAISTRGDFVAYVDEDGRLGVCDVTDPADATCFSGGHGALASCVCFHPEAPVVATGGFDRRVLVWDIAAESIAASACADGEDDPGANQLVNPPFVYALDFAPDCDGTVVSGHADGRLMQFVRSRPEVLATAGLDCTIRLWDADAVTDPGTAPAAGGGVPAPLGCCRLAAKPDAIATSEAAPVVYVDQDSSIVAYALV